MTQNTPSGQPSPRAAVETYLKVHYDFRKNIVTSKVEYKGKGEGQLFKELDDYTHNSIRRELVSNGMPISSTELKSLLNSNYVQQVDVIRDYLTTALSPNLQEDYITQLADTVTTTNQDLWRNCFKKWLVAVVASAVDIELVNHQVLVLVGGQGVGKTTWLNGLLPKQLKGYLYGGYINPNNKDTLSALTENLFINLDELGSLRSHDLDSLKELITKPTVQFRRAYSQYAHTFTRRASFMGSVNRVNFLTDDTGNRRFLPFTVTSIDFKHTIDMNAVYGQAYKLFKEGFKHWFDNEDVKELEAHNEQYMETTLEQDLIQKWFERTDDEEGADVLNATDVNSFFKQAENLPLNYATTQRIGATLSKLGFKRVKRKGLYKYILRWKIDKDDVHDAVAA